ncbi:MAG: NAD(P)/FAD-dependent oxidoreductase [Candidatus Aminicenantes bacterium]|nr:NAD(P)/FAD-dependent oxidoreductase [Candidatus Aminicenantes bacterium]
MSKITFERREFIKSILAGIPVLSLDWNSFPRGDSQLKKEPEYDAIIIGAGLGGLSCAAAFARQGYKVLVIEQHDNPGGYARAFKRHDFTFDVSLHSTTVGIRDGVANLISGFPEITNLKFVPHQILYRAIYPDYDIRVPHRDLSGYIALLRGHFPEEAVNIENLFADIKGFVNDLGRIQQARGQVDMANFPKEFPFLFKNFNRTWGAMMDDRIQSPKLKAIISGLWGYFGLPPSKLSPYYYAMPLLDYLESGGYYPVGTSQAISNAFAGLIKKNKGKIQLRTRVEKILTKDHAAYGVQTDKGEMFHARAIISNANAIDTLNNMIDEPEFLKDTRTRMDRYSISYSSFQVWLGLKKDLVSRTGLKESEIFYYPDYDIEADYQAILSGDLTRTGFGLTIYDNLYKNYSPPGKNTLNIMTTQGFGPWEKYEKDYFSGEKTAYRREKLRIADMLISQVEKTLLPGLRKAIEVKEIATPLTNKRYTGNPRGAIYGWNQTVDNSGNRRFPQKTPIKNLYLAGAWTLPGHGYSACIPSGLLCFSAVMEDMKKSG